jgi:integrase
MLGEELPPKYDEADVSFQELVVAYFDHHKGLLRPNTLQKKMERMNAHWLPLFDGRPVTSITRREIERWIVVRLNQGRSKSTIHSDLKELKAVINWGVREKLVTCDSPVPPLPKITTRKITVMNEEQAKAYLSACSGEYYLFAVTALLTGMRRGELLDMKPSDIDFERRLIEVRPDASHKNIRGRVIPMRPDLAELLKDFKGFSLSFRAIQYHHGKAREAVKMPTLRFHDLRHTFASLLIKEGFDLSTVSGILGHSSDRLTRRIYVHIYPDHARKVVEGNPIVLPVSNFVTGPKTAQQIKTGYNSKSHNPLKIKKHPQPDSNRCCRRERANRDKES